jgi:predicted nucleic acid-binding protein
LNEAVLDASVVLKWFHSDGERHVDQAMLLRQRFETGELRVLAPPLLWLEILNIAGRRWHWSASRLEELAATLPSLGFELVEPSLSTVARWVAAGLTAYDAAYVALAEESGIQLYTDDGGVVDNVPALTIALSSVV